MLKFEIGSLNQTESINNDTKNYTHHQPYKYIIFKIEIKFTESKFPVGLYNIVKFFIPLA